MAIKVIIASGAESGTAKGLYQWDCGQVLEISAVDLGSMVGEVHFSCQGMSEAIVHSCSFSDGFGTVEIPNQCLEQASPITAWIYEINGTQGKTRKTISLPVIARPRPGVVHEIPQAVGDKYAQLITEVNEAVNALEEGKITASKAQNATRAEYATNAGNAVSATNATYASSATIATQAASATNALNATNDGDGNKISDTYLKRVYQYKNTYVHGSHTVGAIAGGVLAFKIITIGDDFSIIGQANVIVDVQNECVSPICYIPYYYGGVTQNRMCRLRFVYAREESGGLAGGLYHINVEIIDDTGTIIVDEDMGYVSIAYNYLSAPYPLG